MRKTCIIGHFATFNNMNDGQTVKTREIYKELVKHKKLKVETVDTQNYRIRIFKFIVNIIKSLKSNDCIIVIVASGGMKLLIPFLVILNVFFRKKICYCAVGSWVDVKIKNNIFLKYILKKLDLILVETTELKLSLKKMNFNNVDIMYNFKAINNVNINNHINNHFCTFSRINKLKGIEDAIYAINLLNSEGYSLYLDIYGPIKNEYEVEFNSLIEKCNNNIRYCGNKNPEDSLKFLSQYDMLLFPTHYEKEGLPGTLIDAYNAGLPVIASSWMSSSEFVPNEVGYTYNFADKEALVKTLKEVLKNRNLIEKKRNNCKKFVEKFTPSKAIIPLLNFAAGDNND